jgi:hypothetical protein
LRVKPSLEDESGGELIDYARGSPARISAGGFESGMGFCGGETLVPKMNSEVGRFFA